MFGWISTIKQHQHPAAHLAESMVLLPTELLVADATAGYISRQGYLGEIGHLRDAESLIQYLRIGSFG